MQSDPNACPSCGAILNREHHKPDCEALSLVRATLARIDAAQKAAAPAPKWEDDKAGEYRVSYHPETDFPYGVEYNHVGQWCEVMSGYDEAPLRYMSQGQAEEWIRWTTAPNPNGEPPDEDAEEEAPAPWYPPVIDDDPGATAAAEAGAVEVTYHWHPGGGPEVPIGGPVWYLCHCPACNRKYIQSANPACALAGYDPVKGTVCPWDDDTEPDEIAGPMDMPEAQHAAELWNLEHAPAKYADCDECGGAGYVSFGPLNLNCAKCHGTGVLEGEAAEEAAKSYNAAPSDDPARYVSQEAGRPYLAAGEGPALLIGEVSDDAGETWRPMTAEERTQAQAEATAEWKARQARGYAPCPNCDGTGAIVRGWGARRGDTYTRPCVRCEGTGRIWQDAGRPRGIGFDSDA